MATSITKYIISDGDWKPGDTGDYAYDTFAEAQEKATSLANRDPHGWEFVVYGVTSAPLFSARSVTTTTVETSDLTL